MMPVFASAIAAIRPTFQALAAATPAAAHHPNTLIHVLLSFGIVGVFLVSIVDSSFVPLPIPGITDIMIVVLAAQHANLFLLIGAATGRLLPRRLLQLQGRTIRRHGLP